MSNQLRALLLVVLLTSLTGCQISSQAHTSTHAPSPAPSQTLGTQSVDIHMFSGIFYGTPGGFTAGSDGNMWFATPVVMIRIAPNGDATKFPLSDQSRQPRQLISGKDGNLWFFDIRVDFGRGDNSDAIGRVTPSGAISEFPLPGMGGSGISGMAIGSDGNVWFEQESAAISSPICVVGHVTASGVVTEFTVPDNNVLCYDLTAVPGGDLWFIERIGLQSPTGVEELVRARPDGTFSRFSLPGKNNHLAVGPDHSLWFGGEGHIGSISPTGTVTEYPLPAPWNAGSLIRLGEIGADGNLWFEARQFGSGQLDEALGRITPTGTIAMFDIPLTKSEIGQFIAAPDGNIWFDEYSLDGHHNPITKSIGRMTPAGAITTFPTPVAGGHVSSFAVGIDHRLWFVVSTYVAADTTTNQIGRISFPS